MIRYRCSPYRKLCRFGIGSLLWYADSPRTTPHNEKSKLGFRGEYVRKAET